MLDMAFKDGTAAPLIAKKFKVAKVDVGRFDRNVDVAETYGLSLKRGVPAVVMLSDQSKVVYSTRAGELANARKMGDSGIYDSSGTQSLPVRRITEGGNRHSRNSTW